MPKLRNSMQTKDFIDRKLKKLWVRASSSDCNLQNYILIVWRACVRACVCE